MRALGLIYVILLAFLTSSLPTEATKDACKSVCIRSKAEALVHCSSNSNHFRRCSAVGCRRRNKGHGWRCHPWKLLSPTAINVAPVSFPRGCRSTCHTRHDRAIDDCWFRERPIRGCHVSRCTNGQETAGWECVPLPSPAVHIHRGCRNLCYVEHEPARDDCWFQGRPVAGCQITSCTARKDGNMPRKQGWVCAPVQQVQESVAPMETKDSSASPIPNVSETSEPHIPSDSPEEFLQSSISPSPSPVPNVGDTDSEFISLTHASGRVVDDRVEMFGSPVPQPYEVKYDAMLTSRGIVSLNALHDRVYVNCSNDGTVHVNIYPDVGVSSLDRMYPTGAILAVSRERFGACDLSPPLSTPDGTEDEDEDERRMRIVQERQQKGSEDFRDAFLFIETVSGMPRNAVIRGTPTSYFAMFDNMELSVQAANPDFNNSNRMFDIYASTDLSQLPSSEKQALSGGIAQSWNIEPLQIGASLNLDYSGGIKSYTVNFNPTSIDVSVTISTGWKATAKVDATLKAGLGSFPREEFDFIRIPLYGVQTLDFFKGFVGVSIPEFKLGIFLEVHLLVEGGFEITKKFPMKTSVSYESEVTETTYSMRGPYTNIKIDSKKRVFKDSVFSSTAEITELNSEPVTFEATLFTGIATGLSIYMSILSARTLLDVGTDLKASRAISGPFAPDTDRNSLLKLGVCDKCHEVTVDVMGKVKNPRLILILGIDVRINLLFTERRFKGQRTFRKDFPNLQLSAEVLKSCMIESFTANGVSRTCGTECCCSTPLDNSESICELADGKSTCASLPTVTPTSPPSPSPTPSPKSIHSPPPLSGVRASCYTDPHLRTFDGLSFDCQAVGEFTMVISGSLGLEIQARFEGPSTQGTVTKGIATKAKNFPTVEMSIHSRKNATTTELGGCPVQIIVEGNVKDLNLGQNILGKDIVLALSSLSMLLSYPNGVTISFSARDSASFGCYFESLNIFLPDSITSVDDIMGLLGSPNGNPFDDWMKPDGSVLKLPEEQSGRIFEPSYDYCTTQWCVRSTKSSLFTHNEETPFSDFNKCDMPYGQPPNFSSAPAPLQALCGNNAECLVDGLAGSIEDARATLAIQSELENIMQEGSKFRFDPSALVSLTTVNIAVTLNLAGHPSRAFENLDHIAVYMVDSNETNINSITPTVLLFDDGSTVHTDANAGDRIFNNVFALQSSTAGGSLSFRAVPVHGGRLSSNSELVSVALDAVRIYSPESGIGVKGEDVIDSNRTTIAVSPNQVDLFVTYSWPLDQHDLDTATNFLDDTVGFSCGAPSPYLIWDRMDVTALGGEETVIVHLGLSRRDGMWAKSTTVTFRAGWYFLRSGSGPATLRMVLRNSSSGLEISDSALSAAIMPSTQSGCATTVVATLDVDVNGNSISLLLSGTS